MIPIDFKNTHPKIYQRVEEVCIEQGGIIYQGWDLSSLFGWNSTEEGAGVWREVNSGNFDPWYEYWGIMNPETKLEML